MASFSPSGALSPYYYKGGYFHGIHYGDYLDDMDLFLSIMAAEEAFILRSPNKKRIMIDLYGTNLTKSALAEFVMHIERMNSKIYRLAVSCDVKMLRVIQKALVKGCSLPKGCMRFAADMEEAKTWLVSDTE